jgi:hypothetical protein
LVASPATKTLITITYNTNKKFKIRFGAIPASTIFNDKNINEITLQEKCKFKFL